MILYNVTVSIDPEIQDEWTAWMREIHIPEVISTGCFTEARLSKIHSNEGDTSFSIMYFSPSQELYDTYQNNFAPEMQKKHTDKFSGKFAAFRTLLNVIEEFK